MENKEIKTQAAQPEQDILSKAKANSKMILTVSAVILVLLVAVLAWFLISQNNSKKSDVKAGEADLYAMKAEQAMGVADRELNDSLALECYKAAAEMGHKSGNRAKLEAAIRLYQKADYQGALDYLKDASISDNLIQAGAYTLMGDCYVGLKNNADALKAFDKAISAADENPTIVPLILIKKANIYRAEQNFEGEYNALKEIVDNYPSYNNMTSYDVRKHYERAKAAAGK